MNLLFRWPPSSCRIWPLQVQRTHKPRTYRMRQKLYTLSGPGWWLELSGPLQAQRTHKPRTYRVRGGATAFRQWGQDFLFILFTACSRNFSGDNNIILPPQVHLSGGKLPPLPYGGAAHVQGATKVLYAFRAVTFEN